MKKKRSKTKAEPTAEELIASWRWRIAKAGLEEGEFARGAGINPTHLSAIMAIPRRRNPRPLTILKLENHLVSLGVPYEV